ncbi:hypothetical protein YC2023_116904 [Brassica napus]
MFTVLKVECDKIRYAPCEGCLRTLVEGIKSFVVRPGVEILTTCFPREDYELSSRNLTLGQDLGLITALEGVMTTSTYVFRIVFVLILSRLKVCDMFSAYVTLATALFFLRNRRSQPCFVFLVVVSAWPCSAPPVTVSGSKATRSSKSSLSRDSLLHHRHLLHESPSSSISVVSLRHALVSVVLRSPRGRRD